MHFWVLPLVAYLQHSLSYDNGDCEWDGSLVRNPGSEEEEFLHQLPVENIFIYKTLNDSAINLTEKLADSMAAVRNAYLTGLVPAVTIRFQQPVKPTRQKPEVLQIEMLAAPLQEDKGNCGSGVFCGISWYLPMPMLNGSVVMHALVKSNGLGPVIQDKSFAVCVNGFLKMKADEPLQWAVGNKVQIADLDKMMSLYSPSRPLWYTRAQAPVLILGGFPNYKIILMTNKEFEEFMPIEVAIDSCWMGTLSCPQHEFSSTIFNAIATESTLFIRQNQLVYYFTGNYSILPLKVPPSTLWTRVLNNVCVEKILPVLFPSHGKEHVLALGGGWQKGEIFLGTIEDGKVSFSETLKGNKQKLCQFLKCKCFWNFYKLLTNTTKERDF
ncbi:cation channel sperm-associated auxiliary subunit gamma-like isoform X2 [Ascaphus truei]|uniref:cation channel sperm-associated auxiliary subunit gamma-like isoform X2 n=1 Tax=Ascaphus truei TaxID=8439 RepID=UPI003F5A9660